MRISVYISTAQIQVLGHDGKNIKNYVTYPLPEGVMYNGTIIDYTQLLEALFALNTSYRGLLKGDVTLIVDGSTLLSRKIVSPKLSHKQYMNLVRDEFVDSFESLDDIVCGYRSLHYDESAIQGFAVNKAQVDSYISVFNEAGISLHAINIGSEAVLNFVNSKAELNSGVIALNIIDGMTMLTMIFVDGSNVFMSRSRLFGDSRESFLGNILDNLSGLMQFTQSQKLGQISKSYYLGLSNQDINYMIQTNPQDTIQITTTSIYDGRGNPPPPEAHFCAMNMKQGSGSFDLIHARGELNKYIKSKKPKKTGLFILIMLIIALLIPTGVLAYFTYSVENKVKEIEAFLASPEVARRLADIEVLKEETAKLAKVTKAADEVRNWESTLPVATGQLLDEIIFNHNVDVVVTSFSFNEKDSVIRIIAACLRSTAPNDYINAILSNEFVSEVNYLGFSGTTGEEFTFSLDIYLNAGGVR